MKRNSTDISIVLDRSGSMAPIWADTIGGLNGFLKSQRNLPGEVKVSLTFFNEKVNHVLTAGCLTIMGDVSPFDYPPTGYTALYDAIQSTIDKTGARLAALPEDERPERVLVVILTDGEENASKEATAEKVAESIKHQESVYSWDFVFLGANQDAVLTAKSMGIAAGKSLTYQSTNAGMGTVFETYNTYVSTVRSVNPTMVSGIAFSAEDIAKNA